LGLFKIKLPLFFLLKPQAESTTIFAKSRTTYNAYLMRLMLAFAYMLRFNRCRRTAAPEQPHHNYFIQLL
jgi:hypothetical protein